MLCLLCAGMRSVEEHREMWTKAKQSSTEAKSVTCVRRRDLLTTTGYTTLANKAVEQPEESKEHGELMVFYFSSDVLVTQLCDE